MRREIFYGNAVKVAIADAAAETAIATPRSVRCYNDLSTMVRLCVVNVEFQRSSFVGLDERKKVFGLVQDRIGADDKVCVSPESGQLCRRVFGHVQDVPDVFVGAFEGTEADGYPEKTLASPSGAGGDEYFSDSLSFTAVNSHGDFPVEIGFEKVFEGVVVLIKSRLSDGNNKVEESF